MHAAKTMTYKAYIDNIKAKTGKDPEYFQALAKERGLAKHGELLTWLKSDCGLGHGHATAIILYIQNPALAKEKIREDARKEKAKKQRVERPPRGGGLSWDLPATDDGGAVCSSRPPIHAAP